jgi:hypothetical protein
MKAAARVAGLSDVDIDAEPARITQSVAKIDRL